MRHSLNNRIDDAIKPTGIRAELRGRVKQSLEAEKKFEPFETPRLKKIHNEEAGL